MKNRFKSVLFAAVAAMGVAATAQADEAKVTWAVYSARHKTSNAILSTAYAVHDGNFTTYYEDWDAGCIQLDCLRPTAVSRIDFSPRSGLSSRSVNFKVYASNDGETWGEPIYDHGGAALPDGVLTMASVNAKARYFKFTDMQGCDSSEIYLYTNEMVLETNGHADPFAGVGVGSADSDRGVKVSATLHNAPDGTAVTVYAYAAREDYGETRADWKENGIEFVLGENVASEDKIEGYLVGLDEGLWHWKMFAVAGTATFPSSPNFPFLVGSRADYLPVAYVDHDNMKMCYNGIVDVDRDGSGTWLIFDIGDVPEGYHVAGFRIWPRTNWFETRFNPGTYDLGYETPATGTTWENMSRISDEGAARTVIKATKEPTDIAWTKNVVAFDQGAAHLIPTFYCLPDESGVNKPRYLKIRGVLSFSVEEVEVRIVKDPVPDCRLTVTGDPAYYGDPDPVYGGSTPKAGEQILAKMPVTEYTSDDGFQTYKLKGWTLTVKNGEGEPVVTESTAENFSVCAFTPVQGDAVTLQWKWEVVKAPVMLAGRYAYLDASGSFLRGDAAGLCDGSLDGGYADNPDIWQILLDLRVRRNIAYVGVAPRPGLAARSNDFDIEVSDDGENWTVAAQNRENLPDRVLTKFDFTDVFVRYVRLKSNQAGFRGDVCEFAAFSDDLAVTTSQAEPFANNGVESADSSGGVGVTVKLANSNNKKAFLEAYAAKVDYGEDYAAWSKNGVKLSLPESQDGESRSGAFTGLDKGKWFWRAFAVQGNDIGIGQENEPFYLGSTVGIADAYVMHDGLAKVYNGVASNGSEVDEGFQNDWILFDLEALPPGFQLVGVRCWARSDQFGRFRAGVLDFGYEKPGDFGETTLLSGDAARKVYKLAAAPTNIEWRVHTSLGMVSPAGTTTPLVVFDKSELKHVRYLRIRNITMFNCNEVEFRLMKKSGMLILFQ